VTLSLPLKSTCGLQVLFDTVLYSATAVWSAANAAVVSPMALSWVAMAWPSWARLWAAFTKPSHAAEPAMLPLAVVVLP
jgi:hypothetical protein